MVGEGGVEVGGGERGRLYTYRYTVTTRMTPALRWAAMRAILMFHNCEGQSHKTMSTDHSFWRERRAEADSNRSPSAYQPNALPLGQTGSHKYTSVWITTYIVKEDNPHKKWRCLVLTRVYFAQVIRCKYKQYNMHNRHVIIIVVTCNNL